MSWSPRLPDRNPVGPGPSGSLQSLLRDWLDYIRVRGYTRQTQFGYARYGQEFVDWCHSRGLEAAVDLSPAFATLRKMDCAAASGL